MSEPIKAALLLALICCAEHAAAQMLSGPESLEYDVAGQRYLISNRSAGQILSRSSAGQLSVFSDDPASPAGMEIMQGVVYIADGARIRGYRLSDAVRVVDYPITGASFLNGLASNGSDRLWVSDFSQRRLHEVNLSDLGQVSHSTLVMSTANQPNGVLFDAANSRLLVVSWGSNAAVYAYRFSDQNYSALVNTSLGNLDGIVMDCRGRIFVSSWSTQAIKRFDPPLSAASVPIDFVAGLSNPADLAFNPVNFEIAAPNAGNSTLSFHASGCDTLLYSGFE